MRKLEGAHCYPIPMLPRTQVVTIATKINQLMRITLEDQYQKKEKKECWEESFLVNGIPTMLELGAFKCVRPCFVEARHKSNVVLIF